MTRWENTNPPFATGPARYFIIGTSNTGKTTLASRLIKRLLTDEEDKRQQLVIISPNYSRDQKLMGLAQFAASFNLVVRVYTSFEKASMQKFVDYMDKCALEQVRSVVFIDDPVGVGNFTSNVNVKSPFNSFVTGAKHYLSDIVFSTQAIGSMSASARVNIDIFIFMPGMILRNQLHKACPFVPKPEDFYKLMDTYASDPFCALWVNVQFGRKGVFRIDNEGTISSITDVPA